jgi:hypothetical protein
MCVFDLILSIKLDLNQETCFTIEMSQIVKKQKICYLIEQHTPMQENSCFELSQMSN